MDIDFTAAIEAGARYAVSQATDPDEPRTWEDLDESTRDEIRALTADWLESMTDPLAAALVPHVREQIAREIESMPLYTVDAQGDLRNLAPSEIRRRAARIARAAA